MMTLEPFATVLPFNIMYLFLTLAFVFKFDFAWHGQAKAVDFVQPHEDLSCKFESKPFCVNGP